LIAVAAGTRFGQKPRVTESKPTGFAGKVAAAWGVIGVLLLLSQAIARLTPRALEAVLGPAGLSPFEWVVLGAWTVVSAHGEGYRAFHLRFSPRVVARALHLSKGPALLHAILAPFFCMSLFHATRRGKLVAWGISIMVACFILLLRMTPQPWRGIVDAGVVVALSMGVASILFHTGRALSGHPPTVPTQLPNSS
jgi:hypothetical protein